MEHDKYVTIPCLAKFLGISRIAVYKKVKKGEIEAIKVGRTYAIPKKYITDIVGRTLNKETKKIIAKAVRKTFKEYGEVLKKLGRD